MAGLRANMIRALGSAADIPALAGVLRRAFGTVADTYGLTEMNAPTNPAFVTPEKLKEYLRKPVTVFGLFDSGTMIGCVAVEPSGKADGVYYVERLAVLPEHRHCGHGSALLLHALAAISEGGGTCASIGIMNQNERLKQWYEARGFAETARRTFAHLPFEVCFMSREISTPTAGVPPARPS